MRAWVTALVASVALSAFDAPAQQPSENFTGHYLTGQYGEGVFIEHHGERAFLSFLTYDPLGQPTWFVMPGARWAFNQSRSRFEFAGEVYRVRRGDESPPALHLTVLGNATWYPGGVDTILFSATFGTDQLTRTLRRLQF